MADAAIAVEGLRKRFGTVQALCGIDLTAPPGSVLGLLGPNGAGKTTAVRILTTLLPPDDGTARVAGLGEDRAPLQDGAARVLAHARGLVARRTDEELTTTKNQHTPKVVAGSVRQQTDAADVDPTAV